MSGPTKREAALAHHEAGHAVIGFRERVPTPLIHVSIVPDPEAGTEGHVKRGKFPRVRDFDKGDDGKQRRFYRDFQPDFDDERLVERQLRPRIVALYAGVLAERRFTGRRYNWVGASLDEEWADRFIGWLAGSKRQTQKYADYLWVVAEESVASKWPAIHELAQELLARKTMKGREVKAFLQAGTAAERMNDERASRIVQAAPRLTVLVGQDPEG